jgi:ribose 5-phosphate isomerase B
VRIFSCQLTFHGSWFRRHALSLFWTINHQLSTTVKIAIGSDHAGFRYKEKIKELLKSLGHDVTDFGTHSEELVDYPLFIRPVAEVVARGEFERGVVLGGSGNGEAITANRVKGVRCALCWNLESARLGRLHNNANVISIGERMVSLELALEIVRVWLDTPFEGGRHQHRIELIDGKQETT